MGAGPKGMHGHGALEDARLGFVIAYKKSRRGHKFEPITLTGT